MMKSLMSQNNPLMMAKSFNKRPNKPKFNKPQEGNNEEQKWSDQHAWTILFALDFYFKGRKTIIQEIIMKSFARWKIFDDRWDCKGLIHH